MAPFDFHADDYVIVVVLYKGELENFIVYECVVYALAIDETKNKKIREEMVLC